MTEIEFNPQEPKNQNTGNENLHYMFMDWKYCFKAWVQYNERYPDELQMVISTHPITSGYWIEPKGKKLTKGDYVYVGKEVDQLLLRVKNEHESALQEERGIKFTL